MVRKFFSVSKATVKFYNMKIYAFRHIDLSTHLIDTLLCVIYVTGPAKIGHVGT